MPPSWRAMAPPRCAASAQLFWETRRCRASLDVPRMDALLRQHTNPVATFEACLAPPVCRNGEWAGRPVYGCSTMPRWSGPQHSLHLLPPPPQVDHLHSLLELLVRKEPQLLPDFLPEVLELQASGGHWQCRAAAAAAKQRGRGTAHQLPRFVSSAN